VPDDKLAAELTAIRERGYRRDARVADAARLSDSAATDVPRLLAAVDAVLASHRPLGLYGNAATEDEPDACPHGPDYDGDAHFEDGSEPGEWLCVSRPEGTVCETCIDSEGAVDWPCSEYQAIARALLGGVDGG
jgi:hypothetical protein